MNLRPGHSPIPGSPAHSCEIASSRRGPEAQLANPLSDAARATPLDPLARAPHPPASPSTNPIIDLPRRNRRSLDDFDAGYITPTGISPNPAPRPSFRTRHKMGRSKAFWKGSATNQSPRNGPTSSGRRYMRQPRVAAAARASAVNTSRRGRQSSTLRRTRWLANAEADHGGAILRRRASAHRPVAGAPAAKGVDAGGPRRGRRRPAGQGRPLGRVAADTSSDAACGV